MLRFADHPRWVPFTNNTGKRALRLVKRQAEISGCHRSEDGAAHWQTVRSSLDSARKHGLSAFEAIHRTSTGNLWMPPGNSPRAASIWWICSVGDGRVRNAAFVMRLGGTMVVASVSASVSAVVWQVQLMCSL
ncbi:hypothetical protein ACIBQ1_54900 [Nonomuraea sp. NPDC050153]|uniref:hypothetical protein n=1 Tax=Nonomuraea sp. NPDC050153 TaxID=3364359 RepID=UPI003789E311